MTLRLIVFEIGVTPPQFLNDLRGIKHPVRIHHLARLPSALNTPATLLLPVDVPKK
jgi:hypothetical protein